MQVSGEGGIRVGAGINRAFIVVILGITIPWAAVNFCSR
jgi:hypothetical protein